MPLAASTCKMIPAGGAITTAPQDEWCEEVCRANNKGVINKANYGMCTDPFAAVLANVKHKVQIHKLTIFGARRNVEHLATVSSSCMPGVASTVAVEYNVFFVLSKMIPGGRSAPHSSTSGARRCIERPAKARMVAKCGMVS